MGTEGIERTTPFRSRRIVDEYEPFDEVRAGDAILLNGTLRKVRQVTRTPDDAVRFMTLAKLQPSWTTRPTTTLSRNDLKSGHYRFGGILARGVSLCTTPLECAVQRSVEDHRTPWPHDRETVGVVR